MRYFFIENNTDDLITKKKQVLLDLSKRYNLLLKEDASYLFSHSLDRKSYLVDVEFCKKIYDYTYYSDLYPFGKVDKNLSTGCIEKDENKINIFNQYLQRSLNLIIFDRNLDLILKSVVKCFLPLKKTIHEFRENGSGCSVHWFKGAVFLSLPKHGEYQILELALNVIHEVGHQSLMLYQDVDALINDGLSVKIYSAIRETERPAILSLHALVAVYFMLKLIDSWKNPKLELGFNKNQLDYICSREEDLKKKFLMGAYALKDVPWTNLGKSIFSEMINDYKSVYAV